MRHFAFTGLLAAALLALSGLGSTTAFASHVLPTFSVETGGSGTSGAGELGLTGANIKCTSAKLTLTTIGSKTLLKFLIDLEGCSLGGKECHSLGDTGGVLLVPGEAHLVLLQGPSHRWLVLFLVPTVHVECLFLNQLVRVQGSYLGNITPNGVSTKNYEIGVNTNAEGKQEFTTYENDAGEIVSANLEGSINTGAFKAATEKSAENKITFEKATEIVN